jgi:uncharacterized protein Usg
MRASTLDRTFQDVVSFDKGETVQDVTVGYDYTQAEMNYPHAPDYAECFEVFVFDDYSKDITLDVPEDEYQRLVAEAKADHKQVLADANAY